MVMLDVNWTMISKSRFTNSSYKADHKIRGLTVLHKAM